MTNEAHEFLNGRSPLEVLAQWLDEAAQLGLKEPLAMVLSTVDESGSPQSRVVLAKALRPDGVVFFTNYHSQKGREIERHPKVAVNFYWDALQKQVRLSGAVQALPPEESDNYWRSRARASQISQYVSQQSQPLVSRQSLESSYKKAEQDFTGQHVPRPPHWGGYLVMANAMEFWLGRPNRLHDRFAFRLEDGQWLGQRLFP